MLPLALLGFAEYRYWLQCWLRKIRFWRCFEVRYRNSQTMGGYGKLAGDGRIRQTRRPRADTANSQTKGGYGSVSAGHW